MCCVLLFVGVFCFKVDNRYVVNKLKVILLPVLKKDWYRLPSEDEVKDDVGDPNVVINVRLGPTRPLGSTVWIYSREFSRVSTLSPWLDRPIDVACANLSINRPIYLSIKRYINQSGDRSIDQPTYQSTNKKINQPIKNPTRVKDHVVVSLKLVCVWCTDHSF